MYRTIGIKLLILHIHLNKYVTFIKILVKGESYLIKKMKVIATNQTISLLFEHINKE